MINVLLIEDSAVFVLGLKLALSGNPAFGSVESVASPGAAVAFLNAHPETDIAVVDITLESETDGLTLLGILREAFPAFISGTAARSRIPSAAALSGFPSPPGFRYSASEQADPDGPSC